MHTSDYYIIIYFSVQVGFRRTNMDVRVGDILEMKKQHPCGNKRFRVLRVGMDFKIKCEQCGHEIMLPRVKAEKNIKKIIREDA
jgi:hypothetical protein